MCISVRVHDFVFTDCEGRRRCQQPIHCTSPCCVGLPGTVWHASSVLQDRTACIEWHLHCCIQKRSWILSTLPLAPPASVHVSVAQTLSAVQTQTCAPVVSNFPCHRYEHLTHTPAQTQDVVLCRTVATTWNSSANRGMCSICL